MFFLFVSFSFTASKDAITFKMQLSGQWRDSVSRSMEGKPFSPQPPDVYLLGHLNLIGRRLVI